MDIDLLKSTPNDQIDTMMMSFPGNIPQYFDTRQGTMTSSNTPTTLLTPHNTISFSNNNNVSSNNYYTIPSPNNSHLQYEIATRPTHMLSEKQPSMAAMREMIFKIAAMQPIYIDPEAVKPPKRRNVKISKDPQSVAARHRRERISEKIRILQRLVPGGTKMDTASMLDEAIHYMKFLKTQVKSLESTAINSNRPLSVSTGLGFPVAMSAGGSYFPMTGSSKTNYSLGGTDLGAPQQFSDSQ